MQTLPNMTVLSPCDATETKNATLAAILQCRGPVYIRFGREPMPDFTEADIPFEIGKARIMLPGNDLTLIATGHLVWEALLAAQILEEQGIKARVLNISTIKPIDRESVVRCAAETRAIITVEEHQINGGLGSTVAGVVVTECPVPMAFIGMNDRFGESGPPPATDEEIRHGRHLHCRYSSPSFQKKIGSLIPENRIRIANRLQNQPLRSN